jgi:hypothetical protein
LHGKLPIELSRIIERSKCRARELAKKDGVLPISNLEVTGEKKQKGKKPPSYYIFKGDRVTGNEVADILGIRFNTFSTRLRVGGFIEHSF